ncbi:MAG TPA: hypothetical protein VFY87_10710 [Geminicoccaceae bacterium]|nr:hypothetical protein [Geminicoccaceae bacterium]
MEQRAPAFVDGARAAPRPDLSLLAQRLRQALARSLKTAASGPMQDGDRRGRGLIPGVEPERLDLRVQELLRRPIRPDGALALALNSFLPWLPCPESLRLGGVSRFRELNFDVRCPTGVRGTPPHIELVASGADGVVGVTVRVFDYLGQRQSRLSPAYASFAVPAALASWAGLAGSGVAGADRGRSGYVDVPALTKLALGLGRIFARRPVKLLYLFLEPVAAAGTVPFAEHRAELARLVERTRGSAVALVPVSFHELWEAWGTGDAPPGLRGTIAEVSRRYAVAMPR